MNKKRILLLGGNFSPEPTGIGKYNGDMVDWLGKHGFDCAVVTTYPYYPHWKVQPPYEKRSWWYSRQKILHNGNSTVVYRCPHYIPKNPSGLKRVVSDISFMFSSFFVVLGFLFSRKYDYVLTVVPPFQLGMPGLLYKWIRGARLIYHIQDLQIDAAKDLGMIRSKALLNFMFAIERFFLKKADFVSSISYGMIRKIKEKVEREILFFPNWVDTSAFFPLQDGAAAKSSFGIGVHEKVVLYSGAIGEKQGLDMILFAAEQLRGQPVRFVICGSGPYQQNLINLKDSMGLQNVLFLPLQPKESFNAFLNMADVHLVLQKANADDLVMPSKLTAILSVGGLALITAPAESSLRKLVSEHDMGVLVEPESLDALVAGILACVGQVNTGIRHNARGFAEQFLQIDQVIGKFTRDIGVVEPTDPVRAVSVA